MKILDKLGLGIFSTIILITSIITCIVMAGWIDTGIVADVLLFLVTDVVVSKITAGTAILFILLAIKCLFFNTYSREEARGKDGILLENDNGKLLISRDTIENLTNSVIKSFNSAESVMTKVELDAENNITIFITLFVKPDAIIKDLTTKLQADVKATIKKSIDLEVKEINVRIKNIVPKKEPVVKELN